MRYYTVEKKLASLYRCQKKSYEKIDWITKLVTSIRSTKVDLDVSPSDFIDISIHELDEHTSALILSWIEINSHENTIVAR